MARSLERSVRFVKPGRYILNMLLFLILVGGVVYYLSPWSPNPSSILIDAFDANPPLNGLILGVLTVGVFYNLGQAAILEPAINWVEAFRETVDPRRARLPKPPGIINAVAKLLLDADERGGRLSFESTRAILDSIATRMDEGREMGRYIGHLLVFLGLLGTFWGLLETVGSVGRVIQSLDATSDANRMFDDLKTGLAAPLGGMGIAFSSSLFGLAGSLVLGFLDLQASQAQNRFYTDLEDWLSTTVADLGAVELDTSNVAAPLVSAIQRLEKSLEGAGSDRSSKAMVNLASSLQELVQHMRSEQQMLRDWVEAQAERQNDIRDVLERLAREDTGERRRS